MFSDFVTAVATTSLYIVNPNLVPTISHAKKKQYNFLNATSERQCNNILASSFPTTETSAHFPRSCFSNNDRYARKCEYVRFGARVTCPKTARIYICLIRHYDVTAMYIYI